MRPLILLLVLVSVVLAVLALSVDPAVPRPATAGPTQTQLRVTVVAYVPIKQTVVSYATVEQTVVVTVMVNPHTEATQTALAADYAATEAIRVLTPRTTRTPKPTATAIWAVDDVKGKDQTR